MRGDIVRYQDRVWLVTQVDGQTRTVFITDWEQTNREEVANDDPEMWILYRPQLQWYVITAPIKSNAGRLVKLTRTVTGITFDLKPLEDWVPSDINRSGGSIFLNPSVGVRRSEVLVTHHKNGSLGRIDIGKLSTIAQKVHQKNHPKRPPPKNVFEAIMEDDDGF